MHIKNITITVNSKTLEPDTGWGNRFLKCAFCGKYETAEDDDAAVVCSVCSASLSKEELLKKMRLDSTNMEERSRVIPPADLLASGKTITLISEQVLSYEKMSWDPDKWDHYFKDDHDFIEVYEALGDSFCRNDILKVFTDTLEGGYYLRIPLFSVLIMRYGNNLGFLNGTGEDFTKNREETEEKLFRVKEFFDAGLDGGLDLSLLYDGFVLPSGPYHVKGVDTFCSTGFLYFLCLAYRELNIFSTKGQYKKPGFFPLILDDTRRNRFTTLMKSARLPLNDPTTGNGYEDYVRWMVTWAAEMKIRPDALEIFLSQEVSASTRE